MSLLYLREGFIFAERTLDKLINPATTNGTIRKDLQPLIFIAVLSMFSFWWLLRDGLAWYDFPQQWPCCAYTLRGIDIYIFRGTEDLIPEIGKITSGFHATPWGLVLQNIFYGGFLPYGTAEKYFIVVNIIVLIITSYILYGKTKNISIGLGIYALVMSLLSVDFLIGLHAGNAGAVVCAFLVTAWALRDEHEYIAGILAGIAMMKPQDALIVCFAFLLHRNYKLLITAAIVDIAAWFTLSVIVHKGMFELLWEFLFASERQTGFVAGIFHPFFENYVTSLIMSMLSGIIFVFLLYKYLPADMPGLFKAYPACMASVFWCYSYSTDCYILIVPAILCIWLMMLHHSKFKRMFWFLSAVYCSNAVSTWSRMLTIVSMLYSTTWYVTKTIYGLGLIIIGIIMCWELRHIYSKKALS